jgi:hypothetical protein
MIRCADVSGEQPFCDLRLNAAKPTQNRLIAILGLPGTTA